MKKFSILVLGSSSAMATPHRDLSGQVININEKLILVDCSEGTQNRLRYHKIRFSRINHIFISHLHGDHFFGLIGLLSTMHLTGRTAPLKLFAPVELMEIIDLQLRISDTQLKFEIDFVAVDTRQSKMICDESDFSVTTIPLNHRIECCGFLFREASYPRKLRKDIAFLENIPYSEINRIKGGANYRTPDGRLILNKDLTINDIRPRSYAYCSDTAFHKPVADLVKGVDLLYHEATFGNDRLENAAEKFHSTAEQAATIAAMADVKQLMIGHFSTRYDDPLILLEQAQAVFPNTIAARDGLIIDIY